MDVQQRMLAWKLNINHRISKQYQKILHGQNINFIQTILKMCRYGYKVQGTRYKVHMKN